MPQLEPPPGTITRKVAVKVLQREKIIVSPSMLLKLKGIRHTVPEGRSHGFYDENDVLRLINSRRTEKGLLPLDSIYQEEHTVICRQATPDDMPGVYAVAHQLFGHTTSAEDRIPLVRRCPEGNLVVTDNDKIVSYIHIQPLKREPLMKFLNGEFRGSQITAEYLDPFEEGKVVDILIKSVGSYHEHQPTETRYSKALFWGLGRELVRWGSKGYIINKVYATSETIDGIKKAAEFRMTSLGKIPGSKGKKRFAFVLNPYDSTNLIAQHYCKALDEWKAQHPEEYKRAWEKYNQ